VPTVTRTAEAVVRELLENWAGAVRAKDFAGILHHHPSDILMLDLTERRSLALREPERSEGIRVGVWLS
jgi:ketosteroid isomerase-like protein